MKNNNVMKLLNPALAESSTEREKKRAALNKALDVKKEKLEKLKLERKNQLLKEIKEEK